MSSRKSVQPKALWSIVILASIVGLELLYGPFFVPALTAEPTKSSQLDISTPVGATVEMTPLSAFGEILARPLFSKNRRPREAPTQDTASATPNESSGSLQLLGVVMLPNVRMALLRSADTPELIRAFEGQDVSGWRVRLIKATEVVLTRGSDDETLKIEDDAIKTGDAAANNGDTTNLGSSVTPIENPGY